LSSNPAPIFLRCPAKREFLTELCDEQQATFDSQTKSLLNGNKIGPIATPAVRMSEGTQSSAESTEGTADQI